MHTLTINLLEGFDDDEVVISVDGVETDRRQGVTSRLLLGMADQLTVEIPAGAERVGVAVPARDLAGELRLPHEGGSLLVNIERGQLDLREGTGREGAM